MSARIRAGWAVLAALLALACAAALLAPIAPETLTAARWTVVGIACAILALVSLFAFWIEQRFAAAAAPPPVGTPSKAEGPATTASDLTAELGEALSRSRFRLLYQPKMRARSGEIEGAEALIRWDHAERGLIPPDEFVPTAEVSGHIRAMTDWTVRQAIADQRALAARGVALPLHVNISARLIGDVAFTDSLLALTAERVGTIGIEITETAMIDHPERGLEQLRRLADAGLRIAIDDYGVGMSSLSYLKQLPAHELKIDRAFISGISRSHRDPLLVRSTIDLAHALGLEVTAEGVETPAALALLKVMGCDIIQGFLIARPMPLDELIAFVEAQPNLQQLPNALKAAQ